MTSGERKLLISDMQSGGLDGGNAVYENWSGASPPQLGGYKRKSKKRKSKKKKSKKNRKSKNRKRKFKRNKLKKNKSKRKNSKNKTYRKTQNGGAEAFWAGYDAADDGDQDTVLDPRTAAGLGAIGVAYEMGGPNAAAATAATIVGGPIAARSARGAIVAPGRIYNNNLCQCRGWHFQNPQPTLPGGQIRNPGTQEDFKCKGCLPKTGFSGLFRLDLPTPNCPDVNSCCRGRFQGTFGQKELTLEQPELDEGRPVYLCSECKQSRVEIKENNKDLINYAQKMR